MFARSSACFAIALLLGLFTGCGDDESPKDAADGGKDSGLEWMPDSGAKTDSGTDAGGVRECAQARESLPTAVLPLCTAATFDCVVACDKAKDPNACRSDCVNNDKHKPSALVPGLTCGSCVYLQLFACADQNGCHEPTADTFCCLEDKCGPGSADGCSDTMCGDEITAALTCAYSASPDCLDYTKSFIAECFETSSEDGGVEDAGE